MPSFAPNTAKAGTPESLATKRANKKDGFLPADPSFFILDNKKTALVRLRRLRARFAYQYFLGIDHSAEF